MRRLLKLTFVQLVRGLLLFLGLILLVFVGVDLLFRVEGYNEWWGWLLPWVAIDEMSYWPHLVLGATCLLLPFLYLSLVLIQNRLERGIVGKGKEGDAICLSPEAIERVIVREVRSTVPEVLRVRVCEATQGWGTARIRMNLAVSDRSSVPSTRKKVELVVQDVLERLIGYAEGTKISVKVTRLAGSPKRGRKQKAEKEKKPEVKSQEKLAKS